MGYHNLHFRNSEQLKESGFTSLAGHYSPKQEDMMMRVVSDAKRANKEVAFSGNTSSVEVWQRSKR
jgi:uncharacterized protein YaeQ